MRIITLLILAAALYATPVLLFESAVIPELEKLKQTYSSLDVTAQRAAGIE